MSFPKHHRRSIRLKDYDYTQEGAYFITICTFRRQCIFGDVVDDEVFLNTLGCIVETEWNKTAQVRPYVIIDEYVVMPNHFHGILIIDYGDSGRDVGTHHEERVGDFVRATRRVAPMTNESQHPKGPKPRSIGAIVGQFKSIVTKQINRTLKTPGASVWQRNYYERIIRNEDALNNIRAYILQNPARWAEDENHPDKI